MHTIIVFIIGGLAGFVGSISAGGGLISIPGLIFLGADPITAIATTRLNVISGGMTGSYTGAHVALTRGNQWVKTVLTVVVIISGVKLLIWA